LQPALQVKLLRTLQEREIMRVGGHQTLPVDVRVVAATHRNLEELVEEGEFRGDLYYRLRGVEIELPPLRARRQEVPLFLRHFTERFCSRESIAPPQFTPNALSLMLRYDYPGNVRELQNLVEGAVSLAEGGVDEALIRGLLGRPGSAAELSTVPSSGEAQSNVLESDELELAAVERRHILRVLRMADGNKSAAARLLGVDRRTLQRKGY
jgi:DNA-binding NtrC family response regulator